MISGGFYWILGSGIAMYSPQKDPFKKALKKIFTKFSGHRYHGHGAPTPASPEDLVVKNGWVTGDMDYKYRLCGSYKIYQYIS